MWGHANLEEKRVIQELEEEINVNKSPIGKLIELSLLYIEPCHNYEMAIELIKSILRRDRDNENAKILMAFCCIHYLMSKSDLEYAEKILNEVITTGKKNKGEAYMLLAEVLQDLGKLKLKEEINLLELSVKFEPEWVSNHYLLSYAYEKMENLEKAIEHMNIAIKNLVDEKSNWSIAQYYYESFMTGRVSVRNYLEMDLKEMIKKLNKKKKKWSFIKRKKRRKPGE